MIDYDRVDDAEKLADEFLTRAQKMLNENAVDRRAVTIQAVTDLAKVMMIGYQAEVGLTGTRFLCESVDGLRDAVNYLGRQTGRGTRG